MVAKGAALSLTSDGVICRVKGTDKEMEFIEASTGKVRWRRACLQPPEKVFYFIKANDTLIIGINNNGAIKLVAINALDGMKVGILCDSQKDLDMTISAYRYLKMRTSCWRLLKINY